MAILSMSAVQKSLPVWEEWIEISGSSAGLSGSGSSLPVWEEWIEITSPEPTEHRHFVSSRMGRVD